MKWVSSLDETYKVGQVDDEIIFDAQKAGLSEIGIESLKSGDKKVYKIELDKIPIGNIWACTSGYTLWFNSANESERKRDYNLINMKLRANVRYT